MLSIIDVKCPDCGAEGRIILPPLGAIIIGPCPECQGVVAVFCGKVLPLDGEIMQGGSLQEKKEHLMEVLGVFVHERIEQFFTEQENDATQSEGNGEEPEFQPDSSEQAEAALPKTAKRLISEEEMNSFLNVDLKLIDNREYFNSVFK